MRLAFVCAFVFAAAYCLLAFAEEKPGDKPRVFITDSQSWEISGHAGGSGGAFGAETHGGARPQTAEIGLAVAAGDVAAT